eukprot:m.105383 g.105383  ORF g.105383 m.105383 type:complete len:91 (-) comp9141_c0_seq1:236-508(-)
MTEDPELRQGKDDESDEEEAQTLGSGVPTMAAAAAAFGGGNYDEDEDEESWMEIMKQMKITPSQYDCCACASPMYHIMLTRSLLAVQGDD